MLSAPEAGQKAEAVAAVYLGSKGYHMVAKNWRTRWCEIDIIARMADTIVFVEVKYRRQPLWGEGLDYITPQKLAQMSLAAEYWVSEHSWNGDYMLSVIEVAGPRFVVTRWIESVT